jgi:MFS family permease
MGVPANKTGTLGAFSNAGLAVGALSAGLLVDIIGRKWTFNLTCLVTSVFGMLVAAPRYNYYAVGGIYFLACLGLGGNIPIDALIALEFLPQNRRNLVALLSLWQPVGVVVACVIAYAFADPRYRCSTQLKSCVSPLLQEGEQCCTVSSNMGWRYTLISIGAVTLFVFFLRFFVFKFHESPKFLLAKGREQEAIDVLHEIAKFNRAPPPTLTVEHFAEVERLHHGTATEASASSAELAAGPQSSALVSTAQRTKAALRGFFRTFAHLKLIAATRLQLFIFILLAVAYMGDYWSFNLAGNFLPIILAQYNTSKGVAKGQETYKQYIWINLPGILGAIFALVSVQLPIIGRKWSLVISAVLQGLAMAMYTQVRGPAGYVGLNALEYIMQTVGLLRLKCDVAPRSSAAHAAEAVDDGGWCLSRNVHLQRGTGRQRGRGKAG